MKRSQIILFIIFLVFTGGAYFVLSKNKKEDTEGTKEEKSTLYVPTSTVKNSMKTISLISYGQISPHTELLVSFEVQGKLERGNVTMKPGVNFKKGQILYRINNTEAFYTLSSRKSSFANLILSAMPDIEMDFPSEKDKWLAFLEDLNPALILPAFPKVTSDKERLFLTSRNIYTEYYNLSGLEARMDKYLWIAPFSGSVIDVFSEPGSIVNPGAQVAKIIKTGSYEVKVPISMNLVDEYKQKSTANFTTSSGKLIATGKIIRISNVVNQKTQSADVYYSIKPVKGEQIYNGMFVNVSIDRKATKMTMTIPRTAMKNGKVNIISGEKLIQVPVEIVGAKPDSIFVSGLEDGTSVVLEQVEEADSEVKYKGINR